MLTPISNFNKYLKWLLILLCITALAGVLIFGQLQSNQLNSELLQQNASKKLQNPLPLQQLEKNKTAVEDYFPYAPGEILIQLDQPAANSSNLKSSLLQTSSGDKDLQNAVIEAITPIEESSGLQANQAPAEKKFEAKAETSAKQLGLDRLYSYELADLKTKSEAFIAKFNTAVAHSKQSGQQPEQNETRVIKVPTEEFGLLTYNLGQQQDLIDPYTAALLKKLEQKDGIERVELNKKIKLEQVTTPTIDPIAQLLKEAASDTPAPVADPAQTPNPDPIAQLLKDSQKSTEPTPAPETKSDPIAQLLKEAVTDTPAPAPDPTPKSNLGAITQILKEAGTALKQKSDPITNFVQGTSEDTIMIKNCTELQSIDLDLNAKYLLNSDIDCAETKNWNSGAGFKPIGLSYTPAGVQKEIKSFKGTLDGQNHAIKNLSINRSAITSCGLFGEINGAKIQNLKIDGLDLVCSGSTNPGGQIVGGAINIGSIAGSSAYATLSNIEVKNAVVYGNLNTTAGGIAGFAYGGKVERVSFEGSVTADDLDNSIGWGPAGGLFGNCNECTITESFASGSVRGRITVGGLVGWAMESSIENSFASGQAEFLSGGSDYLGLGGLVGAVAALDGATSNGNTIKNSYATGRVNDSSAAGGLVGVVWKNDSFKGNPTALDSYFDQEASGLTKSAQGIAKSTAEMKKAATFGNWDFQNVWQIEENKSYPQLRWHSTAITPPPEPTPTPGVLNDPLFAEQWALHNTGQNFHTASGGTQAGTSNIDINFKEVYENQANKQGKGIVVAVIDSGLSYTHPDIDDNLWVNQREIPVSLKTKFELDGNGKVTIRSILKYFQSNGLDLDKDGLIDTWDILASGSPFVNGVDEDSNGYVDDLIGWDLSDEKGEDLQADSGSDRNPYDWYGHGTHVAGTIAAEAGNNTGIVGVAPLAQIMPIRIFDSTGSTTNENLISAIYYAVNNHADIVNLSLGGEGTNTLVAAAIEYAQSMGVVVVAAAGNANQDLKNEYPANIESVISVGATDAYGQKTNFSNWGNTLDTSAPGQNIISLLSAGSLFNLDPNKGKGIYADNYLILNGTSMAAPHIAGVLASAKSNDPSLTPARASELVHLAARDTGDWWNGFDRWLGYGQIDQVKTLDLLKLPLAQATFTNLKPGQAIAGKYTTQIQVTGSYAEGVVVVTNTKTTEKTKLCQAADISTCVIDTSLPIFNVNAEYLLEVQLRNTAGGKMIGRKAVNFTVENIQISVANKKYIYGKNESIELNYKTNDTMAASYQLRLQPSRAGAASIILKDQLSGSGKFSFNTNSLPFNDEYTIVLEANYGNGNLRQEKEVIYFDGDLLPGFPVVLPPQDMYRQDNPPQILDLDEKPGQEVYFVNGRCFEIGGGWNSCNALSNFWRITAEGTLNETSNLFGLNKAYTQIEQSIFGAASTNSEATLMLNSNPITQSTAIRLKKPNTTTWQTKTIDTFTADETLMVDLDGDGTNETLLIGYVNTSKGDLILSEIHILSHDGKELQKITIPAKNNMNEYLSTIIGNFDNNPKTQEILVTSMLEGCENDKCARYLMTVFDKDGKPLWENQSEKKSDAPNLFYISTSSVDIDNDGNDEIVMTHMQAKFLGQVYSTDIEIYSGRGELLKQASLKLDDISKNGNSKIIFCDLKNDGKIEAIITNGIRVWVIDLNNNSVLFSWEISKPIDQVYAADFDNDNELEIAILTSNRYTNNDQKPSKLLRAFEVNGIEIVNQNFPKAYPSYISTGNTETWRDDVSYYWPQLTDLNNDGIIDLFISAKKPNNYGNFYLATQLSGPSSSIQSDGSRKLNQQHNGHFGLLSSQKTLPIPPTPEPPTPPTPPTPPPATPPVITAIKHQLESDTSVTLSWETAPATAANALWLGLSESALVETPIASTATGKYSYTISNLQSGKRYYFKIVGTAGALKTETPLKHFQLPARADHAITNTETHENAIAFGAGNSATISGTAGAKLIVTTPDNPTNLVAIATSTTITASGSSTWNGVLSAPADAAMPSNSDAIRQALGSSEIVEIAKAIEVGSSTNRLNFSKPVELTIAVPNSANSKTLSAVYSHDTGITWQAYSPAVSCTVGADLLCRFAVPHFSQIALASTSSTPTPPNPPTTPPTPPTQPAPTPNPPSSGGGGSGGGPSAPNDLETALVLSAQTNSETLRTYRPIQFSTTSGRLVRPVEQYNYAKEDLKVTYPKDLQITQADESGQPFLGQIYYPRDYGYITEQIGGTILRSLGSVKVWASSTVKLDRNFQLTIPYSTSTESVDNINIYRYLPANSSYELVNTSREVKLSQKTISVQTDQLGIYYVLPSSEKKIQATLIQTSQTNRQRNNWYQPFVRELQKLGVLGKSFTPDKLVNRAEVTTMVVRGFGIESQSNLTFIDVPKDSWYAADAVKATSTGIVGKYRNKHFYPDRQISRAEALTIVLNASQLALTTNQKINFEDVPNDAWYAPAVRYAVSAGIITNGAKFRPGAAISKAEFAKILSQAISAKAKATGQLQPLPGVREL